MLDGKGPQIMQSDHLDIERWENEGGRVKFVNLEKQSRVQTTDEPNPAWSWEETRPDSQSKSAELRFSTR